MQKLDLKSRVSADCTVETTANGWRLGITPEKQSHYRVAQLDDHTGRPRHSYPWRPPVSLSLRARVSSRLISGTWGFGFWNDPFGLSLGSGTKFLRLPALPQAAWFFHSSPRSYLSFRSDRPAHGFLAQVFCSSSSGACLLPVGLTLPFSPLAARRRLSRMISEDAVTIESDPSSWHSYRILWTTHSTSFELDNHPVLETATSPRSPLGLVLWMDNQFAAFDPNGNLSWGTEANPESAWLEIQDFNCNS
jgi:hypothetical protein